MTFLVAFDALISIEWLSSSLHCSIEDLKKDRKDLVLHKIPKKNKKSATLFREVWGVKSTTLANLLEVFRDKYYEFICTKIVDFPLTYIHGFIEKRSIVTNSKPHVGKKFILKADIKNFYDSISIESLKVHFYSMRLAPNIVEILTQLLTVDGKLPQGFCTSPLMSNLIFIEVDRALNELAIRYNCDYTRYADDLTFSSNGLLPNWQEISDILAKKGFKLNPPKCCIKKKGQAFFVTGLSVNETKPRVPKIWEHALRQELYYMDKFGIVNHAGIRNYPTVKSCVNKISGKINFLHSVEPEVASTLNIKFQQLLKRDQLEVSYSSNDKPNPRDIYLYIDELAYDNLFFLCFTVIEDQLLIENAIQNFLSSLRQNPYLSGKVEFRQNEYLHWNDFPLEVRTLLADILKGLPIRAYIAVTKYTSNYKKEFYLLFEQLLEKRFLAFDNDNVAVVVENNNAISKVQLQAISNKIYHTSTHNQSRRPRNQPLIKIVSKNESLNCGVSDCLLGVLWDYLSYEEKNNNKTIFQGNFERLRPKYRYIQIFLNNHYTKPFTKKNPISQIQFFNIFNAKNI